MMNEKMYQANVPIAAKNQLFLERPRIDALLEKAVKNGIITVTAGAGYGKSRSVYAFARRYNALTTWLQFSDADNDGERFWENYAGAIKVISPESFTKLASIGFPATQRQFSRYLAIPRGLVIPSEKYIIVYDDVHLIRNRAVLSFLEQWVSSPFPNITLVLISRLPLSGGTGGEALLNLSQLESLNYVTRITEEDLRFNPGETVEYLRLLGLEPSAKTAADIYRDTEGWAFALNLAGLSLRNNKGVYVPRSLRSNTHKLMESEVFSALSSGLQKFLIKLTLIEHLVPDLLREITGNGNYSLIDELEQIGSFVQYDAYLNAYRIHNLFLDFLKERRDELSKEEKREVWEKAASWCLRNNFKRDAISYYESSGNYQKLLEVAYSFPLLMPKQIALTLFTIMEAAPENLYQEVPEAWITWFRLLLNLEMFERVEAEVKPVIARLEASLEPPLTADINQTAARILASCYCGLGFAVYLPVMYTRDYSCVRYFERCHYYSGFSGYTAVPPVSVATVSTYVCRVAVSDAGEMERHNEALEEIIAHLSPALNGYGCGLDDLAWGELAFFRNRLSEAEGYFNKALNKAREKSQYEIESHAVFFLLRLNLCRGNGDAIQELLRLREQQKYQVHYINRLTHHDVGDGWFYLQTGQPEKIAAWLKSNFEESDLHTLIHGLEILVKAKYQFAKKRYPAALADLGSRDTKYGAFALLLGKLEIKVMEAVCRYRMNDTKGAFADMETAWELARNNGFFMPFIERGKDMRALAGAAIKGGTLNIPKDILEKIRRSSALYAKNVLAVSAALNNKSRDRTRKTGATISPREKDVLAGLSQGLTREEIAHVLSISINTVKSVTRSIYVKLGAVNRADAIRIATELGLL